MGADGKGGGKVRKAACLGSSCRFLQTQTIAFEAAFAALRFRFIPLCQSEEALRFVGAQLKFYAQAHFVNQPLLFLCLVIWMYSFFDTYDLIRHMAAGEPKEDSLLVPGNYEEIKKLLPQHNRLIGWGLVGIGVWALYETFISTWLYTLLCNLVGNGYAYDIITGIPNVVIAAVLIFAGLKLLGLHPETKHNDDELPPYPHE